MIEQLERDCWSLDQCIAEFALPRVLYFKNWVERHGIPSDFYDDELDVMYEDEWNEVLELICFALTYVTRDYEWYEYEGDFISEESRDESGMLVWTLEPDKPELLEKFRAQQKRDRAKYEVGIRLFAQYFSALWD